MFVVFAVSHFNYIWVDQLYSFEVSIVIKRIIEYSDSIGAVIIFSALFCDNDFNFGLVSQCVVEEVLIV